MDSADGACFFTTSMGVAPLLLDLALSAAAEILLAALYSSIDRLLLLCAF